MPVIAAPSHMPGGGVPASRRAMTVDATPAIDWLDRTRFQHWVLCCRTGVEYSPIVIPSWLDDWLGRWVGPEGTFLDLARKGAGYVITIQSLHGADTG
jgi:hypothetical protein